MARRLKVLNYAVNGSGLGHVTRLVAINRWLERLCRACGVEPEIYFLTTSEADTLVWRNGFASFKIPSKTSVKDSRIPIESYLRMARQWVWNALNLVHPDVLVVDTFPNGSFGELVNALDLAKHRVFVYREMKLEFAKRPAFQAMLPLYDQVLVPHAKREVTLAVPEAVRRRVTFTGPILVRDREELLPRAEARARLGVPEGRLAVYLSAGGGGDETADATLGALLEALEPDPTLHLVVGAGPLYRGVPRRGPNITWLTDYDTVELLSGIDLAFSAAGYNTFAELMYLGVPAVFYAQEKVADIQDVRLARAVEAGAALRLQAPFTAEAVRAVLEEVRPVERRESMREAARALVATNGARAAAAQILSAVLPPEDVEEALEAVTAGFLARLRRLELPLEAGLEALRVMGAGRPRSARRRLRLEVGGALAAAGLEGEGAEAVAERYPEDLDGAALASDTVRQLERWHGAGIDPMEALRLTEMLLRRTKLVHREEAPAALREAMDRLIGALARFRDWRGAGLFVQALPRGEEPVAVIEEGVRRLEAGFQEGQDLYRVMAGMVGGR